MADRGAAGVEREASVVVVGAGPVGLTCALRLAAEGVSVVVCEAEDAVKTDWRASTFHCATLEVLEPTGIVPEMLARGLKAPTYQLRERSGGIVAEFDFGLLRDETRYPFRLQLNQQHVAGMLYERLRGLPSARVRFCSRARAVTETEEGVVVELEGTDGPRRLTAAFAVGADGASSTVRTGLGVDFAGHTYAERFLIVSVREDLSAQLPDLCYVNYVADPKEFLFILRTPESWRVLFPVPAGEPDEEALADERVQARLQGVSALGHAYHVLDRQLYRVHQRVASSFRRGRVLLMGDAAHVNSPIGGVGLNSGIHDASDAAVRLVRLLRDGGEHDEELAAYDAVRRAVARDYVQSDTHANTERLKEPDPAAARRELERMAAVARDPEACRAHLRRGTLLEPLRRYGIGVPPGELAG